MNTRILVGSFLGALLTLLAAFSPAPASPVQDPEDTQLATYMKDINRTLRGLRSSLRDPTRNAESAASCRELQILVTKARGEKPMMTADVPEADRPDFLIGFQRDLVDFAMKLLELESTILDGDNEAAQEMWKDVNGIKSPAHEKYRVKDK